MAQKKSKTWIWILIFAIIILIFAFGYGFQTKTYYIADQVPKDFEEIADALTDEEREYYENRVLFEANYYTNENGNGVPLQELRLNFFTDPSLSSIAVRGSGMQYKGHYKSSIRYVSWGSETATKAPDLYYYDTTVYNGDVISWDGDNVATNLVRGKSLIVKIDNKAHLIKLTAKKDKKFLGITYETIYYGYDDVFDDIMQAIKTNSKKTGDYYITLDLSYYFTIFEYDTLSNKWNEDNIANEILSYAVLKFHYDKNGAQTTNDSIFGVIENDSEFDIRPINVTYYTPKVVVQNYDYATESITISEFRNIAPYGTKLIGWTDENNRFYEINQTIKTTPGFNLKLHPVFEELPVEVVFDANFTDAYDILNGQNRLKQIFVLNEEHNLNLNTFVRNGFKFVNWNTKSDGTGTTYEDGQTLKFEAYTHYFNLYAQWEYDNQTTEPVSVSENDNIRGRTLQITLYSTTSDGGYLLKFKDNSTDYISISDDGENLGYKGYGIFSDIEVVGDEQNTYTISIPDDKDYIIGYIAKDLGVLSALIS